MPKCQQIDRQPNWLKHEEKAAEVCLKEEAAEVCLKQGRNECMTCDLTRMFLFPAQPNTVIHSITQGREE